MSVETVSAALIVKNEEYFLPDCLASLAHCVDEVIVVDTGSTDRTGEIARQAGATVIDFPWAQDFAAARNAGLDRVSSSWVLYIDADERLVLPKGQKLSSMLQDPSAIGARLRFKPTVRGTAYFEYRLFRNHPELRFTGAIHETITPALDRFLAQGGWHVPIIDAELIHLGYEGDITHKHIRNLPMLRRMVVEWPDRIYYYYDLARSLTALQENAEARLVCQQGLKTVSVHSSPTTKSIAALICATYADLLMAAEEDAEVIIRRGLELHPHHPTMLFKLARAHVNANRYAEAIKVLDQLLAVDAAQFTDPHLSVDERIFGAYALELKAVALVRLGKRAEAAACLLKASALEPSEISYKIKAIALSRAET